MNGQGAKPRIYDLLRGIGRSGAVLLVAREIKAGDQLKTAIQQATSCNSCVSTCEASSKLTARVIFQMKSLDQL